MNNPYGNYPSGGAYPQQVPVQRYPTQQMQRRPQMQVYPPQGPPPNQQVYPQQPYGSGPGKISKKIIIWGAGILLLILLIVFIFLSGIFFPNNISTNDLTSGASVELKQGKEVSFSMEDMDHKIKLNVLRPTSVDITIMSNPISATLSTGETKKFDLDDDGVYDLRVKLQGIEDDKATLVVKKIYEIICVENWNCTDWTRCIGGTQQRTCIDSNNCGTEESKPEDDRPCTVVATCFGQDLCQLNCINGDPDCTCEAQNATVCNGTQVCDGNLINSSSLGNCCLGTCEEPNVQLLNCESTWGCLINASIDCTPANLTYDIVIPFFGIFESHGTTLVELRGVENSKCIYYERILNSTVQLNQTLIQTLIDQGNVTQEEVDAQTEIMNTDAKRTIGNQYTCKFANFSNLTSMFERWEQGDFSLGFSCSISFEESSCNRTGDFEGIECTQSCYPGSYCEQFLTSCPKYNFAVGVEVSFDSETIEVTAINIATNSTTLNVSGTVDTFDYLENKTIEGLKIKNFGITDQNLTSLEINCNF